MIGHANSERADSVLGNIRYCITGVVVVIAGLFLLVILLGAYKSGGSSSFSSASDDTNVVTGGLSTMLSGFAQSLQSVEKSFSHTGNAVGKVADYVGGGAVATGQGVAGFFAAVGSGAWHGVVFVGDNYAKAWMLELRMPGAAVAFATHTANVAAIIRPADNMEVPVIDPHSPALAAAKNALPATAANSATSSVVVTPIWPIHGIITTEFGANDMPYELVHTGIDISDGKPSGITPIHPFRPGTVVDVIHSNIQLGNHVIVDHGNGVTSVYGHMYATNVQVGQHVDENSVLGYEGTTGASTGPHVHFEIRINNQVVNPHQFISGLP